MPDFQRLTKLIVKHRLASHRRGDYSARLRLKPPTSAASQPIRGELAFSLT
jgi:hypothetical protein